MRRNEARKYHTNSITNSMLPEVITNLDKVAASLGKEELAKVCTAWACHDLPMKAPAD